MKYGRVTNKITALRAERGISKAHLARRIGVCRSYVCHLENGNLTASGEVMFKIAAYFKLRIEDVFQFTVGE